MAAPRAGQVKGAQSAPPSRPNKSKVEDEDDFGDADVASLLS
jgi:hypothetical protein